MTLKNQIKIIQKDLGKDYYKDIITVKNNQYLYIGSRGIILLHINNSNIVLDSKIIYFKDFDKIIIENKITQHIKIIANEKKVFTISKNKIKDYEKIKNILLKQYEIYQITNNQKTNIEFKDNKQLVNIVVAIILLVVVGSGLKIAQYFGATLESHPKGWIYLMEKRKQKEADSMVEHIVYEYLRENK